MVADERGLALSGRRPVEIAERAEELQHADDPRQHVPGCEGHRGGHQVAGSSRHRRQGRREQHVLEPLGRRRQMGAGRIGVEAQCAPGDAHQDQQRESAEGDPRSPGGEQPPVERARAGDDDREHCEIGEIDVQRAHVETGLVVAVQEKERDRRRDDERPSAVSRTQKRERVRQGPPLYSAG